MLDGRIVSEHTFNPDSSIMGITEMLTSTIKNCDKDLRVEIFGNIVLCGGNTMLNGFSQRLYREIKEYLVEDINVKIIAPENRDILSWIGGSILSELAMFQDMWMPIVHQKCA